VSKPERSTQASPQSPAHGPTGASSAAAGKGPRLPPSHWRGHFRLLPASPSTGPVDLSGYASAFLVAYDTTFGLHTPPNQQERNVAAFRAVTPAVPTPILDLVEILARIPADRAAAITTFAKSMMSIYPNLLPKVLGERVTGEGVGVLETEADTMPAGTSLYWRESNLARLEVYFPQHGLDLRTGQLVVTRPGRSVPHSVIGDHRSNGHMTGSAGQIVGDLGAGAPPNLSNVFQSVATNLAFALESPWGPFAAASISAIFGFAFGGASNATADELKAIGDMLTAVVKDITTTLIDLAATEDASTVSGYFAWLATEVESSPIPPTYKQYSDLVNVLRATYLPNDTGLLYATQHLGHLISSVWVDANELALQALLSAVAAMVSAQQMCAQFASNAAGLVQTTSFSTLEDDTNAQTMLGYWYEAIGLLDEFVNGSQGASTGPATLDWSTVGPLLLRNPADLTAANAVLAPAAATLATQTVLSNAQAHGWPYAIKQLTLQRRVARFTGFPAISFEDNTSTFCAGTGVPGDCQTSGSKGWGYTDSVDGTTYTHDSDMWTSGCSDQNEHETDYEDDVAAHWTDHVNAVLGALDPPPPTDPSADDTGSYAGIDRVASQLQSAVEGIIAKRPPMPPPAAPAVSLVVAAVPLPAAAQWAMASGVQYALHGVGMNGYGLRGPFSQPAAVTRGSGGAVLDLSDIGPPGAGTQMVQVWRQFIFPDPVRGGENVSHGVPQLLDTPLLPDSTGAWPRTWADTDTGVPPRL
jgi:hypothetical protein